MRQRPDQDQLSRESIPADLDLEALQDERDAAMSELVKLPIGQTASAYQRFCQEQAERIGADRSVLDRALGRIQKRRVAEEYRLRLAAAPWADLVRDRVGAGASPQSRPVYAENAIKTFCQRHDLHERDVITGYTEYISKNPLPKTKKAKPAAPMIVPQRGIVEIVNAADVAYLHPVLVQCFFPGQKPPKEKRVHEAKLGQAKLRIKAGDLPDDEGNDIDRPLPYGSQPRILLPYISTYVLEHDTCEVDMGDNLYRFMEEIGVPVGGKNRHTFTQKLYDLAAADIIVTQWKKGEGSRQRKMPLSVDTKLWVKKDDRQFELWQQSIRVSADFKNALQARPPVPVPLPILVALSKSTRSMDIVLFLAYRCPFVKHPTAPEVYHWHVLQQMFGDTLTGSEHLDQFKQKFEQALKRAHRYYPDAKIHLNKEKGLMIWRSAYLIPPKLAFDRLRA